MSDYDAMDAYTNDDKPVLPADKIPLIALIIVILLGAAFGTAIWAYKQGWIR